MPKVGTAPGFAHTGSPSAHSWPRRPMNVDPMPLEGPPFLPSHPPGIMTVARRLPWSSAREELAYGLMRYAEQGADVALGHPLLSEVLSRSPCLGGGVGAEPFGLLAGVPGLAYFFGQRGVHHGHDLTLPYRVQAESLRADASAQTRRTAQHLREQG